MNIARGKVGARVALPQMEVFPEKERKVITCLAVINCATRGKFD